MIKPLSAERLYHPCVCESTIQNEIQMENIHTAKYVFCPVLTDFYNFINAEIEKCSWLDQYVLEIKPIDNGRLSISHCPWIEISHSLADGILNLSMIIPPLTDTCYTN